MATLAHGWTMLTMTFGACLLECGISFHQKDTELGSQPRHHPSKKENKYQQCRDDDSSISHVVLTPY
jgi:hypothetical protein